MLGITNLQMHQIFGIKTMYLNYEVLYSSQYLIIDDSSNYIKIIQILMAYLHTERNIDENMREKLIY